MDNRDIVLKQLDFIEKDYIALLAKKKKFLNFKQKDFDKKNEIGITLEIFFIDVSIVSHSFLCLKIQLQGNIYKNHYRNELKKNIFDLTKNLLNIFKKDRNIEVKNSEINDEEKEYIELFLKDKNFYSSMKNFRSLSITIDRLILLFKTEEQKWYNYFLEAQNNIFSILKGMLDFPSLLMLSYPSNSENYHQYEKAISIFYEFLNNLIMNEREAYTLRNSNSNLQEALHLLMLKQNFEKLILNDQEAYLETVKKYRKWASLLK